ncbi:putative FAD-binding domain-containing protein [Seiridium cardinale]
MLVAADINFIILEEHREVVTKSGACIMLWPNTTRVLDQMGLMDAAKRDDLALHTKATMDYNGKETSSDPAFQWIKENHGYPAVTLPRPRLVKMLYEGLGGHMSKVKTSSSIQEIISNDEGVQVSLRDGTVYDGSIVIGCDGVHSRTRDIMQKEAEKTGTILSEDQRITTFECFYASASLPTPVATVGTFWESHGPGRGTQFMANGLKCHFGIFRRLADPVTSKHTYTEEETRTFLQDTDDMWVAPGLQVKDLSQHITWRRLAYQAEGLLNRWYHHRIVLCGESVAHMASINGMGYNAAFQSAVYLANSLQAVLKADPHPSVGILNKAFADYQETRKPETKAISQVSFDYIRAVTWDSWPARIFIEYFLPWFWGERGLSKRLGQIVSKGRKLDFIDHEDRVGIIPWTKTR